MPSAKAIEVFRDFLSFATLRPPVIDVGLQPEQLTVNCSLIDSMPAIRINIGSGFGSISYTVPAKEFVARYVSFISYAGNQQSKVTRKGFLERVNATAGKTVGAGLGSPLDARFESR